MVVVSEWGFVPRGLGGFIRAGLTGNWQECSQIADEMARSAGRYPMQERWDEQIELNLSASHFGRGHETRMIGARMMHCPNNPRNGGDSFDTGDGTWRDRRWTP